MCMSVSKRYPETVQNATPYVGLTAADAEVLRVRAIAPEVASAREIRTVTRDEAIAHGFRGDHALPGMLIPSWSTQGLISGYQLRPHVPPVDDKGKASKYLWPRNHQLHLDVPPASLPVLHDVKVPILLTESALKADAIQTAIDPAEYCVLAVGGVYGWRSGKRPLSDLDDFQWCTAKRGKVAFRRTAYIVFDSDTGTNPMVSRTRWELSKFLARKGASVQWIDTPTTPDGGKQGIDDALAAGHKLDEMIATAIPAPSTMPILNGPHDEISDDVPEVERLRAESAQWQAKYEQSQREKSTLIQLFTNPHINAQTKSLLVSVAAEAMSAASRDDVTSDGKVRLEARTVANDHRPVPAPGESRPELNRDGSKPMMPRAAVANIIKQAQEQGILRVGMINLVPTMKQIRGGRPFKDTEIQVTPPASIAEFLSSAATYAPAEHQPRKGYTRQVPCEHCGEVHSRTQMTVCNGCGSIVGEKILEVPVVPEDQLDDQIAAVESTSTKYVEVRISPSLPAPAPRNYSSTYFVEVNDSPITPPPLPGMVDGVAGLDRWTA